MITRRTVADILTDNRDRSIYAEARRRGESPALALYRVRTERACHAVLTFSADDDGAPYGDDDLLDAYDVDPVELTRHTAGPVRHVTLPDGTHPDGTVTLPEGATVRLFVYADTDTTPEDDCYSPEDVAAWCDDQWRYVGVAAVVTLEDGTTGDSALWGIERGDYWPGSLKADIWHAVPDLIADAADQAQTTARKAAEREQASAEGIRRDAATVIASALPVQIDPAVARTILVALDAAGLRIVRKAHPVEAPAAGQGTVNTAERLEYLRAELRAERISYSELYELQGLAEHIDPGDVELLEAAGVPEFPEHDDD